MQIDYNNPTDNEIRRIVKEAADPSEQVKILAHLTNRDESVIRKICGMKGKGASSQSSYKRKRGRPNKPWSDEEIAYLYENRNVPLEEQAKALGRCRMSVVNKRNELNIVRLTVWSKDRVDELQRLYKTGLRATAIGEIMGFDTYTVVKKINALRHAKKL